MRDELKRAGLVILTFGAALSLMAHHAAAQDPQPQPQPQQDPQAYPQQPQPYPQQPQPYQQQQQPQPYGQQPGYGQGYQQPAQQQPQTVYITDFEMPQNKITIQPIDLFFFGAINIEYERALGEFFSLAAGAHLNLWEPFEGDIQGYSFRIAPRVYPLGEAPAGLVIGARIEYIHLSGDNCYYDYGIGGDTCTDLPASGGAFGGFIGWDLLAGDVFVLSIAVGASYSTVGNPEWTLYSPSMRFDNLDGEDPLEGAVIPWFRLGVGAAF